MNKIGSFEAEKKKLQDELEEMKAKCGGQAFPKKSKSERKESANEEAAAQLSATMEKKSAISVAKPVTTPLNFIRSPHDNRPETPALEKQRKNVKNLEDSPPKTGLLSQKPVLIPKEVNSVLMQNQICGRIFQASFNFVFPCTPYPYCRAFFGITPYVLHNP